MAKPLMYCHGLPGSTGELRAFGEAQSRAPIHVLDRLNQSAGGYEQAVAASFDAVGAEQPATIVGFSLGAMAALHIAARRPRLVGKLVLISPAAPLQLGDFLPSMAGQMVFRAAQRGDAPLRIMSAVQSALVLIAARPFARAMFRGAPDADFRLLETPAFLEVFIEGMRQCLGSRGAAYRTELLAYVAPWAPVLRDVQCDIDIWQGADDDWTPPDMARALQSEFRARASLTILPHRGHYGALQAALPHLAAD